MVIEMELSPISRCPAVGDRIVVNDKGDMRAAIVKSCIDDQLIEFVFEDDGGARSLVAVLPHCYNPLIFTLQQPDAEHGRSRVDYPPEITREVERSSLIERGSLCFNAITYLSG